MAATGGPGAVTGVFPRGGESNYTLVFVDDVPVNAFGGDYDFGHLSAENIERIEVVRGPQSALFGSNAIGAVVRVITRRGGPPTIGGTVEAGGYDTYRLAASTAGSRGAFEWGASADRFSTDNFNGHVTSSGLTVTNDDYERVTGAMTAGWRKGERSVRAQVRHATDERGSPGPFGENPLGLYEQIDEVSRVDNSRTLASASGALPVGRAGRVLVLAAYNRLGSEFASPFGPSESNSNRWLGRAQLDVPVSSSFDVSAGLELQRERTGSSFITDMEGQEVQVKRRTAAYFAEARWTTSSSLFLTGGLRLDDIHRERFAETVDSDSVVSVNPRAAVAWFVRPGAANYTKLRRRDRHGDPTTGRVRAGLYRQSSTQAGTQLQHRSGDRTGLCRWPRAIRGRCVLQRVRRSDRHRWIFPGLEPIPDRQHRECTRARDRARIDRTSSIECAPGDRRPRARGLHVHGH